MAYGNEIPRQVTTGIIVGCTPMTKLSPTNRNVTAQGESIASPRKVIATHQSKPKPRRKGTKSWTSSFPNKHKIYILVTTHSCESNAELEHTLELPERYYQVKHASAQRSIHAPLIYLVSSVNVSRQRAKDLCVGCRLKKAIMVGHRRS